MKSLRLLLIAAGFFLLVSSCEKKIIEIIPVLQVQEDLSIPEAGDIKYFSFPSSDVGYAASDTNFIYKTIDGGDSWSMMNIETSGKCKGLEFFDEQNGMCLMDNSVYATHDGGETWALRGNGLFIGITEDGTGVYGNTAFMSGSISISNNKGQTFQSGGSFPLEGNFAFARVTGSSVIVFTDEHSGYGKTIPQNETFEINTAGVPHEAQLTDLYISDQNAAMVGSGGLIMNKSLNAFSRSYYGHTYNYNSVDGNGDLIVCVGENTICSNLNYGSKNIWNEVLDVDGNSYRNTFHRIRFLDQNHFYLSGSNGLILKAKI